MAQTLAQIQALVQVRVTTILSTITTLQATYAQSHGRYFQGRSTHTTIPADGVSSSANKLTDHPTHQSDTWADFGVKTHNEPFAMKMKSYEHPQGHGWQLHCLVTINGSLYVMIHDSGLRPPKAQGWTLCTMPAK